MTLSTAEKSAQAQNDYLNEPAPLWMRQNLADRVNYMSRGVEFTESTYKGITRRDYYVQSFGLSLATYAQRNPGNLKIPNTRRVPQQTDVEIPTNTTKPRQGVTISEDVPIATNKQASAINKTSVYNPGGRNCICSIHWQGQQQNPAIATSTNITHS